MRTYKTLAWLFSALAVLTTSAAGAETIVEHSAEARFQLDLHVPDTALAAFLPDGWKPNVAAQGPAKDANLRVVFIDRITINGPDGKPAGKGSNSLVYLAAPVKDPSGANVQLIIGGLTADPTEAPGPFGNYLPATTHLVKRSTTSAATGSNARPVPRIGYSRRRSGEHASSFAGSGSNGAQAIKRIPRT